MATVLPIPAAGSGTGTQPIVVLDLIKAAMRLFGGNGAGITPSSEEANDALLVLNDIVAAWNLDGLMLYGKVDETVNTIAGIGQYTIGNGGQFNVDRPADILGAYCNFGGVDFPIDVIGQDDYNLIALKTQQQPIIERLCYINDFPMGTVLLWPVPQMVIPLTLQVNRVLPMVPNVNVVLSLPPGYLKCLRLILGIELAVEYGAQIDSDVKATYIKTKSDLMRLNRPKLTMKSDPILTGDDVAVWQRGY